MKIALECIHCKSGYTKEIPTNIVNGNQLVPVSALINDLCDKCKGVLSKLAQYIEQKREETQ